jgi:hypothetical protein
LFGGFSARAQTTVTLLGEDFDKSEVIFSVTMSPATPTWVFVDYTTTTPANMSRATFTSVSPGTLAAGDQGFWLTGNATVTAMLKDVTGKFSWCAYAINVPPNAEVKANGGYTLRGTPPFLINGNIPVIGYDFGPGTCITTITDLTCNPAGYLRTSPMTVTATAPATVCAGAPLTFSAAASGGTTTAMSYTWSITRAGNTTSATTHTNAYITALATTGAEAYTPYTYTVYATNANGCTSTVSKAGTLTVYAVPAEPHTASSNTRCGTGDVNFSASTVSGCTIDWYTDPNSGTTVSYGSASYSANVHAGATNTYYAQSRDTTTGCVSTSRLVVTGMAYGHTVTTTDAEAICETGAVTLTATAGGSTTTANTYTWTVGASQTATTYGNEFCTTVSIGTTTFSVSIRNDVGCDGVAAQGIIKRCAGASVYIPGYGLMNFLQGVTMYDVEGELLYSACSNWCQTHGARLPTLAEMLIICQNQDIIPGGLTPGRYPVADSTNGVATPSCSTFTCNDDNSCYRWTWRFRCIY